MGWRRLVSCNNSRLDAQLMQFQSKETPMIEGLEQKILRYGFAQLRLYVANSMVPNNLYPGARSWTNSKSLRSQCRKGSLVLSLIVPCGSLCHTRIGRAVFFNLSKRTCILLFGIYSIIHHTSPTNLFAQQSWNKFSPTWSASLVTDAAMWVFMPWCWSRRCSPLRSLWLNFMFLRKQFHRLTFVYLLLPSHIIGESSFIGLRKNHLQAVLPKSKNHSNPLWIENWTPSKNSEHFKILECRGSLQSSCIDARVTWQNEDLKMHVVKVKWLC